MTEPHWLDQMDEEARDELLDENVTGWDIETKLQNTFNMLKERGIIGEDWYVEFTCNADGEIGGATLAYVVGTEYVNVTIPLWGSEVQLCFDKETLAEQVREIQGLIETKATTLRLYIDAIEAVL